VTGAAHWADELRCLTHRWRSMPLSSDFGDIHSSKACRGGAQSDADQPNHSDASRDTRRENERARVQLHALSLFDFGDIRRPLRARSGRST
jgi:hypothetical protein